MIDVDLERPVQMLLARPGNIGALEQDDRIELGRVDLPDPDPSRVGEVDEGEGGVVPVDDLDRLPLPRGREAPPCEWRLNLL